MSSPNDCHFPLALPSGSRLEHYEILETLGNGAFGVTYRAFSHRFQSPCVIKELLPMDYATRATPTLRIVPLSADLAAVLEKCRHDFMREATILHSVNHQNVVKVLDFFPQNGTSYFVMPYASGGNYERYLKQKEANGSVEEAELLDFTHRVLDGLEAVHSKGYLHRDIKPENIIMRSTGEPLLIDFGAARQLIGSRSRPMSMILTRGYAPFEQYSSTKNQGPYTDLYAFGAVMHRVLIGHPPEEAPNRIDGDTYLPLKSRLPGKQFSPQFLEAIDWALKPQANLRPQTVADFRSAIPKLRPSVRHRNGTSTIKDPIPSPKEPPPLPGAPPRIPTIDLSGGSAENGKSKQYSEIAISKRAILIAALAFMVLATLIFLSMMFFGGD
jgi:serine/threonine protein kinase